MKILRDQTGASHLVLILAAAVAVAVAAVGYRVMTADNAPEADTAAVNTTTRVPETIKNRADVTQAEKALGDTNIDGNINPDQFDSDIKSL